ncbi:MAG: hypothetical protein ACREUL_04160 [Steroidobacteraceae bacterium]
MSKLCKHRRTTLALMGSLLAIVATRSALAASEGSANSASARIEPYLMANQQQEIALAQTAAPPSVSMHATVMVLGAHGYVTAVQGSDGFVCLVVRSWDNGVSVTSALFWNPKMRAPYCWNGAGAQSVLPRYLMRTKWVLAGASRAEIGDREKAAWAAGKLEEPAPGVICYMMSKRGRWIGPQPGPWRPHLMFYFPRAQVPNWGANLSGDPVFAGVNENLAVLMVLVPVWSDGSPAPSF